MTTPVVEAPAPPHKKSVALSGVEAGQTAISKVGHEGKGLYYRGYDIHDLAEFAIYEEVAYLLIHGELPNASQLARYKIRLNSMRGIPAPVKAVLEQIPAAAHPMDVLRTACSMLGTVMPEHDDHSDEGARNIGDRLIACLPSMLLYWYHYARNGKRIDTASAEDTVA